MRRLITNTECYHVTPWTPIIFDKLSTSDMSFLFSHEQTWTYSLLMFTDKRVWQMETNSCITTNRSIIYAFQFLVMENDLYFTNTVLNINWVLITHSPPPPKKCFVSSNMLPNISLKIYHYYLETESYWKCQAIFRNC